MPDFDPTDTSGRAQLSNREVAERFVELFHHQDRMRDAFECWVHPDYIQHNPEAPAGRDATLEVLDEIAARNPDMTHDVKRVIHSDCGAYVIVHHNWRPAPGARGSAVVDIMRIADGYVVEHWDVIQPVPDPAEFRNANTMF